jgi:hypothetical protein
MRYVSLPTRSASRQLCRGRSGFTLIEAAITTVIIGLGVVAMLQLLATGTLVNVRGTETTTAMNLAKNIRERTIQAPFDTLVGMNGQSLSPPIDSRGVSLTELPEWRQQVAVKAVDPDRLTTTVTDPTPQAVRITATISRNGRVVTDMSWYCFAPAP